MQKICLFLLLILLISFQFLFSAEKLAQITIEANQALRENVPIAIALDVRAINLENGMWRLEYLSEAQSRPIPAQLSEGKLWFLLPKSIEVNEKLTLELVRAPATPFSLVQLQQDGKTLDIGIDDQKILSYYYALMPPPPNQTPLYTRSGFIHPIWSPEGKVLTRIHPSDHIHHMGFWHPWTHTEFEGRPVDFWNIDDGQGTVRFVQFNALTTGPVGAGFEVLHHYVDLTAPGGEKIVLNEIWNVRCYHPGTAELPIYVWDFINTQSCASASPLMLLKYRYGGFGFRGTADWNEKNSNYLTSEGKTRKDGNHTRARWCNIFGQTDAGPAGVLLLSHPENHAHPEPMRIWPEGDVFMGFCPIVEADWKLEPGQKYVRQYRVVVYDGEMTKETAEQYWQEYAHPPKIEIKKTGNK